MNRRLFLLTLSTLIGGFMYVPFVKATGKNTSELIWLILPFASAFGVLAFGWLGIRFADRGNLPMPLLRKWESTHALSKEDFKILFLPALLGLAFAGVTFGLNQFFPIPKNAGTTVERILTTPWAAIVTETVSHLFALSGIVLLIKNKGISIVLSSLIFLVLFHLNGVDGAIGLAVYLSAMNFSGATLTGWIYLKYGFESAVIAHATMHVVILALN